MPLASANCRLRSRASAASRDAHRLRATALLVAVVASLVALVAGCGGSEAASRQPTQSALLAEIRSGLPTICERSWASAAQFSCDGGAVHFDEVVSARAQGTWDGSFVSGEVWLLSVVLNGRRGRSGVVGLARRVPRDEDALERLAASITSYARAHAGSAAPVAPPANSGGAAASGGCEHDLQCKGERVCEASVCVSPR